MYTETVAQVGTWNVTFVSFPSRRGYVARHQDDPRREISPATFDPWASYGSNVFSSVVEACDAVRRFEAEGRS